MIGWGERADATGSHGGQGRTVCFGKRDAASRQAAIGACAGAQDLIWSGDTSVMPPLMQDTR